jgi:hypothetical protein
VIHRTATLAIVLLLAPETAPAQDVAVLADYDNNIKVVIKDGEIFKNAL